MKSHAKTVGVVGLPKFSIQPQKPKRKNGYLRLNEEEAEWIRNPTNAWFPRQSPIDLTVHTNVEDAPADQQAQRYYHPTIEASIQLMSFKHLAIRPTWCYRVQKHQDFLSDYTGITPLTFTLVSPLTLSLDIRLILTMGVLILIPTMILIPIMTMMIVMTTKCRSLALLRLVGHLQLLPETRTHMPIPSLDHLARVDRLLKHQELQSVQQYCRFQHCTMVRFIKPTQPPKSSPWMSLIQKNWSFRNSTGLKI
jgi:hypothetical protein